jgi:hypothetical protein
MTHARGLRAIMTLAVAGGTLIAGVPAAVATHQASTASVDVRQVVAGESGTFTFSVAHPSGTGTPLNFVRITVPTASSPSQGLVVPTSGEGPGGGSWTPELEDGAVVFRSTSGLAPGQQGTFTVTGDVPSRPADDCRSWTVDVSSDAGATVQVADPAAAGALTTCVRVVKVESLSLVAPQGATDGTVTQGQGGVCARMVVRNAGSADLVVLPRPEGVGISVGLARAGAEVPCTGSELAEGKAPMSPGETRTFDFRLSFGDASNTVLYGRTTAPGVTAVETYLAITIQPQVSLIYVNGTLIPRSVQPGTPGVVFRLTANKGPAGSPAATLDPTATTLGFAGCGPSGLLSQPAMANGQVANTVLEFESCTVGSVPDGRYDATVTYAYTDENGFAGSFTLAGVDKIRVDGSAPVVQFSLTLPAPACCVPPATQAVRNGSGVTLNGTVKDADPDTGQQEPCTTCFVQTEIRQYQDDTCDTPGAPPVSVTTSNSSGTLGASYTGSYDGSTRSMRWMVVARDEAGNSTLPSMSGCVPVDNVKPIMTKAETQRVNGEQNRLKVTLSECVGGTSNQLDWRLEGNFILEIESNTCGVVDGALRGTIVLRTVVPFPDDEPAGILRFEPLPVVGGRLFDRVDNTMGPQEIPISDGIPTTTGLW